MAGKTRLAVKVTALVIALGACELGLRLATRSRGHAQQFLGRHWYTLLPLGVPDAMPEVTCAAGSYRCYDRDLGWSIAPLGSDPPLYYADRNGVRCSEEAHELDRNERSPPAPQVDPVRYDIIALGDSFTHGDEVRYQESWPALLAEQTGTRVLNLGVGGYGVDQAGMRLDGLNVRAPVAILGLIAGDLERATDPVYRLSSGGLKSKPYYQFGDNGAVTVANRPAAHGAELRRQFALGVDSPMFHRAAGYRSELFERTWFDWLYLTRVPHSIFTQRAINDAPIYRSAGPRQDYVLAVIEHVNEIAKTKGATLVIAILHDRFSLGERRSLGDQWGPLRSRLTRAGLVVVDTLPAVADVYAQGEDKVFLAGGHYRPEINARIAQLLAATDSLQRRPRSISPGGLPLQRPHQAGSLGAGSSGSLPRSR